MTSNTWMLIVGAAAGGLTLLFLMLLVLRPPQKDADRFLVVSILALGIALSAGFLGSWGTLTGNLPIPGVSSSPLQVGLGGGAGVFAVIWLLGYFFWARQPVSTKVSVSFDEGTSLVTAIRITAQDGSYGVQFRPSEEAFAGCMVAEGEITADSYPELMTALGRHLSQDSDKITYKVQVPPGQKLFVVAKNA